jgi:hypothetical protein
VRQQHDRLSAFARARENAPTAKPRIAGVVESRFDAVARKHVAKKQRAGFFAAWGVRRVDADVSGEKLGSFGLHRGPIDCELTRSHGGMMGALPQRINATVDSCDPGPNNRRGDYP